MATVPSVLGHSRISNSRWETFPHSRTQVRKDLVVEEGTILAEEVSLPMDSLVRKATQVDFFHSFGNMLQPLEFVPISREGVVPMEWQVRSVLGDCISMPKVILIKAPHFRQFALISDFLDLANLSIRKEATLATNWIKD